MEFDFTKLGFAPTPEESVPEEEPTSTQEEEINPNYWILSSDEVRSREWKYIGCPIVPEWESPNGRVTLSYIGGELVGVTIDGIDIEEIFDLEVEYQLNYTIANNDDVLNYINEAIESEVIAKTVSGEAVYTCEETAEHMKAHPDVKMSDVAEAIRKIEKLYDFQILTINLCRMVGRDNCIEIDPDDSRRVYEYRDGRNTLSSVIHGVKGKETSLITIGICKEAGKYFLFTAFYGQNAPKETDEEFWSTHAICLP